MKAQTRHWIDSADYDWQVAHHMLKSRSHIYVLFLCHLTIEKLLKACLVEFAACQIPPRIHILLKLAKRAGILREIPEQFKPLLAELTSLQEKTRYAREPNASPSSYTREYAIQYMKRTEALRKWLKHRLASANSLAGS
jgi:HEPN domain-containing protein